MYRYCVLFLAVVIGTQAEKADPCSKQLEMEHRCKFSVLGSPEADQILDRKKQIMQTCAPNLPTECHTQCQAMHDCVLSIAKTMDTDPGFAESKPKSMQGVDQCFVQHPPDVHKGMEEIFMQDWMKPPGMDKNSTGHGRKCRRGEAESKSNETSSEREDKKWEKLIPPQCRPSPKQTECIKTEFKKLVNDTAFVGIMNNLIRQDNKCKQITDWSCTPKCPKQQKCIFEATTPCRTVFMQRMKTCMGGKGFTLPPFMANGDLGADIFTTPISVIKH